MGNAEASRIPFRIPHSVFRISTRPTMNYVYGPIPSRRLGRSLGVDLIPLKTCNWNCIYCQLGRTTPLTNVRREYIPRQTILDEVKVALAHHAPGSIDFISLVGSGEPTLHSAIGWLIRAIRATTAIPLAVITNGALLYRPDVRAELAAADVVMPTLCAGSAELYQQIHRPHPEATFARLVAGLAAFRAEYTGKLWIELMLLRGVNDTEPALAALAAVLEQVRPNAVHVILPERPPAETWVAPADDEGLLRAAAILGPVAQIVTPHSLAIDANDYANAEEAILSIVTRHPMTELQLVQTLARWPAPELHAAIAALLARDEIHAIARFGATFFAAAPAVFPAAAAAAPA
jgi:wyosine [tRNA(Phe)-imidazoG37] synthetase (radical SAM superfamily)